MLTDWRLWKRYPVLVLVRFMQNTVRTTALLFFIMVVALTTTVKKVDDLPVGFIAISLGLNWLLMLYFGAKLRRFKICLYPLMFILNPFFNWYYMVYGIFTAGQRTWGGPRADAATADTNTSAREAVEQAEERGDELNVVPETFKQAHEARIACRMKALGDKALERKKSVVQPPSTVDGKFSVRRKTAQGDYAHPDEVDGTATTMGSSRNSIDSLILMSRGELTGNMNRAFQMQDLMGEEDRRKYVIAQNIRLSGSRYGEMGGRAPTCSKNLSRSGPIQPSQNQEAAPKHQPSRNNNRYAQVLFGSSGNATRGRAQGRYEV